MPFFCTDGHSYIRTYVVSSHLQHSGYPCVVTNYYFHVCFFLSRIFFLEFILDSTLSSYPTSFSIDKKNLIRALHQEQRPIFFWNHQKQMFAEDTKQLSTCYLKFLPVEN